MAFEPTKAFLYDEEEEYRDHSQPVGLDYSLGRVRTSRLRRLKCKTTSVKIAGVPIKTTGCLSRKSAYAWIYVATGRGGVVKIGMSGDLNRRADALQATMRFSVPVIPAAARAVETAALRRLGRMSGDGEWVRDPLETVIQAVEAAMDEIRRFRHVDPHLTFEEARKLRISLATGQKGR